MKKKSTYVKQLYYDLKGEERNELAAIWRELEDRRNVDVRDISDPDGELDGEIVKEISFRDNPVAEPESISYFLDDFMYDDDGNELTAAEIEKIGVEVVEALLDDREDESSKG